MFACFWSHLEFYYTVFDKRLYLIDLITSRWQVPSGRAEKPTPEAMQQLLHRLQAAIREIAALKKQCALAQEQQRSHEKEGEQGDVKPQGRSKEDQLSKDILAMLRTFGYSASFA